MSRRRPTTTLSSSAGVLLACYVAAAIVVAGSECAAALSLSRQQTPRFRATAVKPDLLFSSSPCAPRLSAAGGRRRRRHLSALSAGVSSTQPSSSSSPSHGQSPTSTRRRAASATDVAVSATQSSTGTDALQQSTQRSSDASGASWIASDLERHASRLEPEDKEQKEAPTTKGSRTKVIIYDTTLRDGTQGESISASVDDKLKIARKLVEFGVDYVEAGWPGSNPKDVAFFDRAKVELTAEERSKLVAFGSTRRKGVQAYEDAQVQALLDSQAPTVCLVAKAHSQQVEQVLRATHEENLNMIRDTVSHLTSSPHSRTVFVDLEHFFDGYQYDPEYALQCCRVAVEAGAKCLVLCDTNGGTMPWKLSQICREVVEQFAGTTSTAPVTIGIHTHNDCGMAVANSLLACEAGIGLVQGTINGIGERTGNADLTSIIPSLALHCGSQLACRPNLSSLTQLSRFVDEILNRTPNQAAPYVGSSAFAHKGGLHVAAMERSSFSYQHVEPEAVGNEMRVLISELAGRQNILGMMEQVLGSSQTSPQRANAILARVKSLEARGYTFEGAEASVRLMILHASRGYCPPFRVLDYSANVYDYNMDSASRVVAAAAEAPVSSSSTARATVKVRTMRLPSMDGSFDDKFKDVLPFEDRLEVADGNGPVDALANALLRALQPSHPYLENVELVDYKVRILDPESATEASTRVLIEFRDSLTGTSWTTVSVDTNVISASLNALIDGFEYALIEHAESCMLCDDMFE